MRTALLHSWILPGHFLILTKHKRNCASLKMHQGPMHLSIILWWGSQPWTLLSGVGREVRVRTRKQTVGWPAWHHLPSSLIYLISSSVISKASCASSQGSNQRQGEVATRDGWRTHLKSQHWKQAEGFPGVWGQPGLHSNLQASQRYRDRLCLKWRIAGAVSPTSWTVTAPSPNVKALRTLETHHQKVSTLAISQHTIEESHSYGNMGGRNRRIKSSRLNSDTTAQIMNNII